MAICKSIPVSTAFIKTEEIVANAELKSSLFYDKFADLLDNFENSVVYDSTQDIDSALLLQNTKNLNKFVKAKILTEAPTFSMMYPNLYERLQIAPYISPAETQLIIQGNLLIPELFNNYLIPNDNTVPYLMEAYFASDSVTKSSAGSFCSMANNIFGVFDATKDMINDITAFSGSLQSIIAKINDLGVAGILETIKQKINDIIDKMVEKVLVKIKNFTAQFIGIANTAIGNIKAIFARVDFLKNKIQSYLSENNIKDMKDVIDSLISFSASLFDEIKWEEIMFLLLRFCGLMANIETLFDNLTNPLDDIQNSFENSKKRLTSSSNLATSGAIAAGALRFTPQQLNVGVNNAYSVSVNYADAGTTAGGNYILGDNPNGVRTWTGDGTPPGGRSLRARSARILPPTAEELDALPTWEDIQNGNDLWTYSSSMGRYGYVYAQTLEKVMLLRLRRAWGRKFNINSAYRSIRKNQLLRQSSNRVSENSMHLSGQAFDINVNNSPEFIRLARSVGFGGIGTYDNFTHIDSGAVRSW